MKFKTTKKAIKEGYYHIISVGYCELQYLLKGINPVAYSTRAEGWACDYYDIDGVCICEGYSPIGNKNTNKLSYDTIREYDNKAKELVCSYPTGSWHEVKEQLSTLLREFIALATEKVTV